MKAISYSRGGGEGGGGGGGGGNREEVDVEGEVVMEVK